MLWGLWRLCECEHVWQHSGVLIARIIAVMTVAITTPCCRGTAEAMWQQPDYAASDQALQLQDGARIEYHEVRSDFGPSEDRGHLRCIEASGGIRWSQREPTEEPHTAETATADDNPLAGAFFVQDPRPGSEVTFYWGASAMAADDHHLYIAQWCRYASGAELLALDLRDGHQVWGRVVRGLGPVFHSRYRNRVALRLEGSTLIVSGDEGSGYVEVYTTDGDRISTRVLPEHSARSPR